MKSKLIFIALIFFALCLSADEFEETYHSNISNIKNIHGKFYAYIVLLFNENPHFVNLIEKDSITPQIIEQENFHVTEYSNYLKTISDINIRRLAFLILQVYNNPEEFTEQDIRNIEEQLSEQKIVLKFSKEKTAPKVTLEYCIFGKKTPVAIQHPLLPDNEKFYNIQPYIYYDEFSTSNSTFYFNMIYINPEEVNNDYIIARRVLENKEVNTMFFVGSRVNEDIRFCIKKAFAPNTDIKNSIWEMFVIHELTHKILNNRHRYVDQVIGEELSLSSTIYVNPFLGLSVLYSYLNYNAINPHRIAGVNLVKFISKKKSNPEIVKNPSLIKNLSVQELKTLSKEHFSAALASLK